VSTAFVKSSPTPPMYLTLFSPRADPPVVTKVGPARLMPAAPSVQASAGAPTPAARAVQETAPPCSCSVPARVAPVASRKARPEPVATASCGRQRGPSTQWRSIVNANAR
jgi:hypothetical protein